MMEEVGEEEGRCLLCLLWKEFKKESVNYADLNGRVYYHFIVFKEGE
jgi:hypothetical protein